MTFMQLRMVLPQSVAGLIKSGNSGCQRKIMQFIVFFSSWLCINQMNGQATQTVETGSFIINMGVTPQTVANGIKPYGLLYELFSTHKVPVLWSINPSKVKDGADFTYNGVDYKGGTFIVPSAYRNAAVNATISAWQTKGVVGITTTSPVMVPVYRTLRAFPKWTLDFNKGSIAVPYFTKAEIPPAAYGGSSSSGWKTPAQLTCCDDLFIMPHADPYWATHERLFSWNLECKGGIWAACHAASALENMVNPVSRTTQTNFLTVKDPAYTGTSGNYALSNSLVLWGSHGDGVPPYTYRLHDDPIAQFMGTADAAMLNGSERIYLPRQGTSGDPNIYSMAAVSRWNPGAKVIAYDPDMTNVSNPDLSTFKNVAAAIVYGRGFDDPNRGYVMYEGGHTHDGTGTANVAAMRAFFNFSFLSVNEKAVVPDISGSGVPDIIVSGNPAGFNFSLPVGENPADYTLAWSSTCGGSFSNAATNPTTFTPPVVTTSTPCIITVSITDLCGRVFTNSKVVSINPCIPTVTPSVTPPLCNGSSNGQINLDISGAPGPFTWNWSRVSPSGTGSGSALPITGLSAGTYNITITDGLACTATLNVLVGQPNVLTVSPSPTNYLCFGETGAVNITVNGGNGGNTYSWTGPGGYTASTQNIDNLEAGTYALTVTDSKGCTASTSSNVTGPLSALAVTLDNTTNVTCFGQANGVINLTPLGGTSPYLYNWNDGSMASDRTGLSPGTYTLTVTDANGCQATLSQSITQPLALTLSAVKTDPSCPATASAPLNADGAITLTVAGGTAAYSYAWTASGGGLIPSGQADDKDLTGLVAGNYSVLVTDANNCTANLSITLNALGSLPVAPAGINH